MSTAHVLLLALATYLVIASLATRALARCGGVHAPRALAIAALANLAIAVSVICEHAAAGGTLASLGFAVTGAQLAVCVAIVVVSGILAASFAMWRTGSARWSPAARGTTLAAALIALAAGAWMEEVVFRAFALAWLVPRGVGFALVVSAVVFTLVHVPTSRTDRWALLNWLIGGLALGGTYLATGSVWIAATAHLARNAGNVLWIERTGTGAAPWSRTIYYAVLGTATLGVACVL